MKKEFFKSLKKLIESNQGKREVDVILKVYEYAFTLINKHSQYDVLNYLADIDIKDNETLQCAVKLLNAIAQNRPFDDLLTEFIEVENIANTNLGQYFTSVDAADMIALFNSIDYRSKKNQREKYQYYKFSDECGCGAGSLTLAFLRGIDAESSDFRDFQNLEIWLNDIDENIARIATLTIFLSGVIHSRHIGVIYTQAKNILTEHSAFKPISQLIANEYRYKRSLYISAKTSFEERLPAFNELMNRFSKIDSYTTKDF